MPDADLADPAARVRVLSHVGGIDRLRLPPELADRVEVMAVPQTGSPPPEVRGEVLLSIPSWPENLDEVLARGVRWVHFISTGLDGFDFGSIPTGTLVTNSRGASAVPISEWVLAVMLAFEKQLPDTWIHEPPDDWRDDRRLGTLQGRRLAIVGYGSIGEAVARRALPFGVEVRALRRTDRPSEPPEVEMVRSLPEVLDGADHVVLCAPLTPATRGIIDASALASMKTGVHLVNIARGGLVDQDALRVALDDGRVAMASLDAVDPEPLPPGHWMYDHPHVRLSAHDSWSWPRAGRSMFERFTVNLRAYLAGQPLPDLVDLAQGY
jgi:phosphoglycerate dehydrogenase-like enzyme